MEILIPDNTVFIMISTWSLGVCNHIADPLDRLKMNSRKVSFVHSFFLSRWNLLKFCTEHDSHAIVLCAKFQKKSSSIMNAWARYFLSDLSLSRIPVGLTTLLRAPDVWTDSPFCSWVACHPCSSILIYRYSWWRHDTTTLSALLVVWERKSPVTGGFPSQRSSICGVLMFSLLLAWTNCSTKNRGQVN